PSARCPDGGRSVNSKQQISKQQNSNNMKPLKVKTYYAGLSEHELVTQAGKVLQFMTDNANYATPSPDLAVFEAAYIDYKTKLEKANNGGSRLDFRQKGE